MGRKVICPSGNMSNYPRRPCASMVAPLFDRRDGQQSSKAPIAIRDGEPSAIYMA
jgi:hypothetical protein